MALLLDFIHASEADISLLEPAIFIVHYSARLDQCAWMGMGNWTWPGASTIQLLSLGRWSSSKSGLKSAGDTWHYQLLSVNWEIRKPEALGTHRPVCSSLSYVSFWACEGGFDTLWSLCWCVRPRVQNICLYVKYEAVLAPAAGGFVRTAGLWCRPWTQPGTGGCGLQSSVPFGVE